MNPIDPENGSGRLDATQQDVGRRQGVLASKNSSEVTNLFSSTVVDNESSSYSRTCSNSDLDTATVPERTIMRTDSISLGGVDNGNVSREELNFRCGEEETSLSRKQKKNSFLVKLDQLVATVIPPGGVRASAFNLAACSVGAGILGLPAATNKSGLVMALLYHIVITFFTIYSMNALGVAAQRTQIRTFEGVARALLGRWCAYLAAAVRAIQSLSGCVAYVISVGDIFSTIIKHTPSAPEFLRSTAGNRLLTVGVW
ncbi:amino acid transporter, partial [Trypanosoma theileri]